MKVGELREKLAKLKKEEVTKLAVEFYKLVPKSKKEDYDLDGLINNPQKKKKTQSKDQVSLETLQQDINTFITNAKNQYYLSSNRIVPKKERSTWRFKVKRWYKELIKTNRRDSDLSLQAQLLTAFDYFFVFCLVVVD